MGMTEIMDLISSSNKYIVSDRQPKFLDECPWISTYFVQFFSDKCKISKERKDKLRCLSPLDLPVATLTLNCPIEKKKIAFTLHYYHLNGEIINSATIHYICTHDIFIPDSLMAAILEN